MEQIFTFYSFFHMSSILSHVSVDVNEFSHVATYDVTKYAENEAFAICDVKHNLMENVGDSMFHPNFKLLDPNPTHTLDKIMESTILSSTNSLLNLSLNTSIQKMI